MSSLKQSKKAQDYSTCGHYSDKYKSDQVFVITPKFLPLDELLVNYLDLHLKENQNYQVIKKKKQLK